MVFFFQAEDGIRDLTVTGVQTCALPISGICAMLAMTNDHSADLSSLRRSLVSGITLTRQPSASRIWRRALPPAGSPSSTRILTGRGGTGWGGVAILGV